MSQIEIMSIFGNVGEVVCTTRKGEQKTVVFKACDGGSVALADEDVAEILLGELAHEYRKPGAIVIESDAPDPTQDPPADDDPKPEDTGNDVSTANLTIETYAGISNYQALKSQLAKCDDLNLVMELIAAETQGKNRDGFVKALNERLDALKAA